MKNIKPREMAIKRTGRRSYEIKTKLFDEEVVDQETVDEILSLRILYITNC